MLIESLGLDYAEDTLRGVCFLYNGKPVMIRRVNADNIMVRDLEEDGEAYDISPSVLVGWKSLRYPRLGYRKLDNGLWGWVQRAARSYSRGVDPYNTTISATPYLSTDAGYRYVRNLTGESFDHFRVYANEDNVSQEALCLMRAVLSPTYDSKDVLPKVLAGQERAFIPSARFMVEPMPSLGAGTPSEFGVYMSGTLLGRMDSDMNIKGPEKNLTIIENMVTRYAA